MKTSIWVNNLDGEHFEVFNTSKAFLDIAINAEGFIRLGCCERYDLIQYDITKPFPETTLVIVHKGKNESEVNFILKYIQNKLYDKLQLQQQVQALKKIKSKEIDIVLENLRKDLHDNYFEINLVDIVSEFMG